MFDKFFKKVHINQLFVGYRVRKSTIINQEAIFGVTKCDVYEFTYITEQLSLYILTPETKFLDVQGKVNVNMVSEKDLISKHLVYGTQSYRLDDFPHHSKENIYGVYGIRPLKEVYENLFKEESEVLVSNKDRKVELATEYTLAGAESLVKECNKVLGNINNVMQIPTVRKDINDPIKSVFGLEQDFYNLVSNKTPEQVMTVLKLMVKEHQHTSL